MHEAPHIGSDIFAFGRALYQWLKSWENIVILKKFVSQKCVVSYTLLGMKQIYNVVLFSKLVCGTQNSQVKVVSTLYGQAWRSDQLHQHTSKTPYTLGVEPQQEAGVRTAYSPSPSLQPPRSFQQVLNAQSAQMETEPCMINIYVGFLC